MAFTNTLGLFHSYVPWRDELDHGAGVHRAMFTLKPESAKSGRARTGLASGRRGAGSDLAPKAHHLSECAEL